MRILAAAVMLAALASPYLALRAAEPTPMVTRVFPATSGLAQSLVEANLEIRTSTNEEGTVRSEVVGGRFVVQPDGTVTPLDDGAVFMLRFSKLGVTWPEGSSLCLVAVLNKLIIRNTPENMAIIDRLMTEWSQPKSQVEVEVQHVEFELSDIERLSREGMITAESLAELRRQGRSRLLAAPIVRTSSGSEPHVLGDDEMIYPTEFRVRPVALPAADKARLSSGGFGYVAEPQAFETREVGTILSVMVDVPPGEARIHLTICPEHVFVSSWRDYGGRYRTGSGTEVVAPMAVPFFHSHSGSTQIELKPGGTLPLFGGCPSRDGKKMIYAFVSARIVDVDGKPAPPEKEDPTTR